jgi:hypothetical protein
MIVSANKIETFTPLDVPREALLYEREENGAVTCNLCAHRCYTPAGREEICNVTSNQLDQGHCPFCHTAIRGVWHSASSNVVVPAQRH